MSSMSSGGMRSAVSGYMGDDFPFTAMHLTGGFQIALGIVLMAVGIAATDMDPDKVQGNLGRVGMITIFLGGVAVSSLV